MSFMIAKKRNLVECLSALSPGRDKTSHSYETVTQVEGKIIKEGHYFKDFVLGLLSVLKFPCLNVLFFSL